jgi:hypothetical protein
MLNRQQSLTTLHAPDSLQNHTDGRAILRISSPAVLDKGLVGSGDGGRDGGAEALDNSFFERSFEGSL